MQSEAPTATLAHLPSHVLARILRGASILDVVHVAHVCRALHAHITSCEQCACAQIETFGDASRESARTRAFWTHWTNESCNQHTKGGTSVIERRRHAQWVRYATEGSLVCVHYALRSGTNRASAEYAKALRVASAGGHAAVVARLLRDRRVDPNVRDQPWPRHHYTFEHMVCGRAPNTTRRHRNPWVDEHPGTPIQPPIAEASANGHLDVVDLLLCDERVHPGARDQAAIRLASAHGHAAIVDRLLCYALVDPSAQGQEALCRASANGHAAVVARLLRDDRVDPRVGGQHPLELAILGNHVDVVECFLHDARIDPSRDGQSSLRLAASTGQWAMANRLLQDERIVPNASFYEAVIRHANVSECGYITRRGVPRHGCDGNDAHTQGSSYDIETMPVGTAPLALQWALAVVCQNGHVAMLDALLNDARVDPSAHGSDALERACSCGHVAVVERLLRDERVDPGAYNSNALEWACRNGHVAVVDRLLRDERVDPGAHD